MLVDGVMDRWKDRQHYYIMKKFSSSKCVYKIQQIRTLTFNNACIFNF